MIRADRLTERESKLRIGSDVRGVLRGNDRKKLRRCGIELDRRHLDDARSRVAAEERGLPSANGVSSGPGMSEPPGRSAKIGRIPKGEASGRVGQHVTVVEPNTAITRVLPKPPGAFFRFDESVTPAYAPRTIVERAGEDGSPVSRKLFPRSVHPPTLPPPRLRERKPAKESPPDAS